MNSPVTSFPDQHLSSPVRPTVSPDHLFHYEHLLLGYTGRTGPTRQDHSMSTYNHKITDKNVRISSPYHLTSWACTSIISTHFSLHQQKMIVFVPHLTFNERKSMSRSRGSCRTRAFWASGYRSTERGGGLPIKWILFTGVLTVTVIQ